MMLRDGHIVLARLLLYLTKSPLFKTGQMWITCNNKNNEL